MDIDDLRSLRADQEPLRNDVVIDDTAVLEDLFSKHRVLATHTDLNVLEYFGLVWPAIKTISTNPESLRAAACRDASSQPSEGRIPHDDPGFIWAFPKDDIYWRALVAAEKRALGPAVWLEHANTFLAGEWVGKGRSSQWKPTSAEYVSRRCYWPHDFSRIADLIQRTHVSVSALCADHKFTRGVLESRLARIRDEVSAPPNGHLDLRLYLLYLRERTLSEKGIWRRVSESEAPWLDQLPPILGDRDGPTSQITRILKRFRSILGVQFAQLAIERQAAGHAAVAAELAPYWGTSADVVISEVAKASRRSKPDPKAPRLPPRK